MRTHLALLGALLLAGAAPAAGQYPERPPRSLSISASAEVEVVPDRAHLMLGVETFSESGRAAAQQNAEKMDALIAELRRLGIPETKVRTVSYSLSPEYRHDEMDGRRERRLVGYRAINMVRVTLDSIPMVGTVIDAAVERGGNRVAGLSFTVADIDPLRERGLREAVEQATREARVIADALGVDLGPPLNVGAEGHGGPPPPPMPYAAEAMDMRAAAPTTPVEPGTVQIRVGVHVTFELLPR